MSAEAELHRRLKDAFARAADLTVPARQELLADLEATDPDLAARLAQLLAADAKSGDFLDRDAFGGDAAAEAPPREVAGERGYRLLRPIGAGGMGTVHLAERADGAFRQQVAIKLLHPLLATSADAAGRFRAERQILADLHHPDITRLLDGGTTADGRPFLVMEYVEGEPLDRHADRLPLADRLRLFVRVCRAVDFAHERGIVHRDLKPGNVLVTAEGEPKLLDFGVAKLLEPLPDRTRHETALGHAPLTLLYASPEQVRGEAVTRASDVYSLGVILYRLVTGALPYGGEDETPHGLALAICEREPERPSHTARRRTAERQPTTSRQPLAGRDLDAIVLRALRKEPESRYATAGALADDVDRLLAGLPVTARRGTAAYRAGKLVRRHSWRFALVAAALVAVAATAWLTRRLVDPPPLLARDETGRVAVLPFRNETGSASYAWVEAGLSELVGQQLDEAARVEVVAPSDVRRALRDLALEPAAFDDPAALARLRAALGADFTLAAQVRTSGPGELRIDYVLRGGDDVAARARELRGSEATALARELAGRVVRRLDPGAPPPAAAAAAAGHRLADDATANTLYAMGLEELVARQRQGSAALLPRRAAPGARPRLGAADARAQLDDDVVVGRGRGDARRDAAAGTRGARRPPRRRGAGEPRQQRRQPGRPGDGARPERRGTRGAARRRPSQRGGERAQQPRQAGLAARRPRRGGVALSGLAGAARGARRAAGAGGAAQQPRPHRRRPQGRRGGAAALRAGAPPCRGERRPQPAEHGARQPRLGRDRARRSRGGRRRPRARAGAGRGAGGSGERNHRAAQPGGGGAAPRQGWRGGGAGAAGARARPCRRRTKARRVRAGQPRVPAGGARRRRGGGRRGAGEPASAPRRSKILRCGSSPAPTSPGPRRGAASSTAPRSRCATPPPSTRPIPACCASAR